MPEPFKNFFNPQMIALMGHHFKRVWSGFDEAAFIDLATQGLDVLELKQRSDQITHALSVCLPSSFAEAAPILLHSLHPEDDVDLSGAEMDAQGIRGWGTMPMCEYVAACGLHDFDLSLAALKELTKRGSSEFGIRPFIARDQDRVLGLLTKWASDPNFHIRRLASEGARPRLPWGMQLTNLVSDPEPLMPILEKLKDDPTQYVRRSVANNLNDIAKDHPDTVANIAKEWLKGASPERKKLVRHACRSLIKAGHKKTLAALGYKKPKVSLTHFNVLTPVVQFGDALRFDIALRSEAKTDQDLIIDYVVHHRKANGKTSPKVFKWKTTCLKANTDHVAVRKHAMRQITTRVYYPGMHQVEIMVNGESLGSEHFELLV